MREIKNISNNPLELSDGKMIAPGDTRKLETISDRDKDLQNRGWITIAEEAEKPAALDTEKTVQQVPEKSVTPATEPVTQNNNGGKK